MKKFLTIVLMGLMVFLISGIAAAEDNNGCIYLDYLVSGDSSFNISGITTLPSYQLEPSEYTVGFDFVFGNWVIGTEYVAGSSEVTAIDGSSLSPTQTFAEFNYHKMNVGYRIINHQQFKLDLIGSYYSILSSDRMVTLVMNDYSIDGIMVGTNITYGFSEKASINLNYGTSLSASPSNLLSVIPSKSGNFTDYHLKFHYLLTDNFGVTAGYRSYTAKVSWELPGPEILRIDMTNKLSGYTVGIEFKF